jgi:hypothetical protein
VVYPPFAAVSYLQHERISVRFADSSKKVCPVWFFAGDQPAVLKLIILVDGVVFCR